MADTPTADKPTPDDLIDTGPGKDVELNEDDLAQVSGGAKIMPASANSAFKFWK